MSIMLGIWHGGNRIWLLGSSAASGLALPGGGGGGAAEEAIDLTTILWKLRALVSIFMRGSSQAST